MLKKYKFEKGIGKPYTQQRRVYGSGAGHLTSDKLPVAEGAEYVERYCDCPSCGRLISDTGEGGDYTVLEGDKDGGMMAGDVLKCGKCQTIFRVGRIS